MKIERLNDNQIRCILDKTDFEQRELKISELAYGSAKAKELFRDMMEQAAMEFGFETGDNIPLMIEAIPVSPECLILVVTKVEDPEELDTRFSRFSSASSDDVDMMDDDDANMDDFIMDEEMDDTVLDTLSALNGVSSTTDSDSEAPAEGLDIMAPFNKAISRAKEELLKKKSPEVKSRFLEDEIYVFDSLDTVIQISGYLAPFYRGESILYKDPAVDEYYLMLLRDESSEDLYERACVICSDYGEAIVASYATPAYFKEHFQLICGSHTIQTLNQLN
ncbi:MAG: adaptor protein MecA [Eubacteriales bacterium]|nr:adaptor protein MecA [Eubacteriales bacterium]